MIPEQLNLQFQRDKLLKKAIENPVVHYWLKLEEQFYLDREVILNEIVFSLIEQNQELHERCMKLLELKPPPAILMTEKEMEILKGIKFD